MSVDFWDALDVPTFGSADEARAWAAANDAADLDTDGAAADVTLADELRTADAVKRAEQGASESKPAMLFSSVAEIRDRVRAAGPREWMLEGVWIAGTPMVVGAEAKAGKSFAMLDLAISVASGTRWMDCYEVRKPGPVLCFWAEDDEAEVLRRVDAICAARGVDADTLPLRMCFRAPNLSDAESVGELVTELYANRAAVVILDPLYLAAGENGDGSSIYKMGHVLKTFGDVCRDRGAAPVVIHHWNKTGTGTGRSRFSGSGTVEWARTTVSASLVGDPVGEVETVNGVDVEVTTAVMKWEFVGNSIAPSERHVRRRIWADDASDLNSALHYQVAAASEATVAAASKRAASDDALRAEILRVLTAEPGLPVRKLRERVSGSNAAVGAVVKQLRSEGAVSAEMVVTGVF